MQVSPPVSFHLSPPVMFAALASLCSANELVKLLNRLYARFDHIAHVSRNDDSPVCIPGYISRQIRKFWTDKLYTWKNGIFTHVNGWFPAVYMSCMPQNFDLFHGSNSSVRNFRTFLLMYPWSVPLLWLCWCNTSVVAHWQKSAKRDRLWCGGSMMC